MRRDWMQLLWFGTCFAIGVQIAVADTIEPVSAIATSEFGAVDFFGLSDVFAEDLIDGGGLMDLNMTPDNVLDDFHDNDASWTNGWHSGDFDAGIPGGTDGDGDPFTVALVDEQIIEFDLGDPFVILSAHIWQQNQSGLGTFLAPDRGVDEFEILYTLSPSGDDFTSVGIFHLAAEEGMQAVQAQVIEFSENAFAARRIRFEINSAHSELPNEFVGLAEVRFDGVVAPGLVGDFNGDLTYDAMDIDLLTREVQAGNYDIPFDLTFDGVVDQADRKAWVEEIFGTQFGDANLDHFVDDADFGAWSSHRFQPDTGWSSGDFDGDGTTDVVDFNIWNDHKSLPVASTVPESSSIGLSLLAFLGWGCVFRRHGDR